MFIILNSMSQTTQSRAIAERIQKLIDAKEISGAVTLVGNKDSILHLESHGFEALDTKVPMKDDSIFWIASMTKPLVGTAVMMIQEEGKISVEDPVSKYIPDFAKLKTPSGKPANLTIRQLLIHTSGLAEATPDENKRAKNLSDLIPVYLSRPLKLEPDSQWMYSQSSINTAAHILELVTGKNFSDFVQERIFKPLGINDTGFYLTEEQSKRLVKSYEKSPEGSLKEIPVWILDGHPATFRQRYPAANGGLFSAAQDYYKFCRMILNQGELEGRRFLKPSSIREMTRIHTGTMKTGFEEGCSWGLTWTIISEPRGAFARLSKGSFGHEGAYGTQGWIDPVKGLVYVFLIQRPKDCRYYFDSFLEGVDLSFRTSHAHV